MASSNALLRFSLAIAVLALCGIAAGWWWTDESLTGMGALMGAFSGAAWIGSRSRRY